MIKEMLNSDDPEIVELGITLFLENPDKYLSDLNPNLIDGKHVFRRNNSFPPRLRYKIFHSEVFILHTILYNYILFKRNVSERTTTTFP